MTKEKSLKNHVNNSKKRRLQQILKSCIKANDILLKRLFLISKFETFFLIRELGKRAVDITLPLLPYELLVKPATTDLNSLA